MTLNQIRSFLEVAGAGNFNRAAERLNVTQSTVSARIKALEGELGQALFRRSRAGADLTPAGRRFQRHALSLVRVWEQSRADVVLPEGFEASLSIAGQMTLWDVVMLPWLGWMRANAPQVVLRVEADYSQSMMEQLSEGLLDLAVMYQPRRRPGLVVEPLIEEPLTLVSTRPRRARNDWIGDYVLVDWGEDFRDDHARAFPQMETPAVTVGLGELALAHILKYGGSAYLPERLIARHLEQRTLHRVEGAPVFARKAYLVTRSEPANPALIAIAVEGLRQIAD